MASIDEARLVELFSKFAGFTYSLDHGNFYPYELPGVNVRTDGTLNNCCTFVEALIVKAFENAPGFGWSRPLHDQMMVVATDWFSPVTAAIDSGMATGPQREDEAPAPWTIVQGWKQDPPKGGHTFLIVDHDLATDRVLVLESNSFFKLNGPGYRELGPLDGFGAAAPAGWRASPECPTWAGLRGLYKHRRHAPLNVTNRVLTAA